MIRKSLYQIKLGISTDDTLVGGSGNDWIYGADGDDNITDNFGKNTIYGRLGNDTIIGSKSSKLYGDAGNDTITGSSATPNSESDFLYYINTVTFDPDKLSTILANAAKQVGDDTVINLKESSTLILKDFDVSDLKGVDFTWFPWEGSTDY